MTEFIILNQADIHDIGSNIPVTVYIDGEPFILCSDEYYESQRNEGEKTCLNCGTSEQECELGNRARHGFCGNWTERG